METRDWEKDPEQIIRPVLTAYEANGTVAAEFDIRRMQFSS